MKYKIILKTTNKHRARIQSCLDSWLGGEDYVCLTDHLTKSFNEISGSNRDDYRSAESKTVFMMNYIKDHPEIFSEYDWVIFIDDDAILNTRGFKKLLPYLDKDKFYGLILSGCDLGPEIQYPSGGAGYFLSPQLINKLSPMKAHGHGIEDFSVGQWLKENNIKIDSTVNIKGQEYKIKLNGWNPFKKYDPEGKLSPEELIKILDENRRFVVRDIMSCLTHHYVKEPEIHKYINEIFRTQELSILQGDKMKTAIIFGITGQDGSHLADLLLSKNYKVIGVSRRSSTPNNLRIKHLKNIDNFKLIEGDITDYHSVLSILKENEHVDEVYNLAAQSHVGTSFKQPGLTWDITGKGCFNILQAIVDAGMFGCRFYQASSSEMFGSSYTVDEHGNKYQDENTKFLPQSPYAISKCASHYAVRLFREAYNLHASAGILFNHEGPRRGDNFVTKKITNWIVDFKLWLKQHNFNIEDLVTNDNQYLYHTGLYKFPKLRLGNLDAYRDWGYAGDYVEAMWLMLQQENGDDYVICTGKTYTIKDFLDKAFNHVQISNWSNFVTIDQEFYRPAEVDYLCGNNNKAKTKLGWEPKHDLDMLVSLMIDSGLNDKLQNHARHI